jgi:hypothetical protein
MASKVKYDFKIRITVENHSEDTDLMRIGVVCHKCMNVVYTNRIAAPPELLLDELKDDSMYKALAEHVCA